MTEKLNDLNNKAWNVTGQIFDLILYAEKGRSLPNDSQRINDLLDQYFVLIKQAAEMIKSKGF